MVCRALRATGSDDAATVIKHCGQLRSSLKQQQEAVLTALGPGQGDARSGRMFAAWLYALDTMIETASRRQTCAWHVEGIDPAAHDASGEGDITLRRV